MNAAVPGESSSPPPVWEGMRGWVAPKWGTPRSPSLRSLGAMAEEVAQALGYPGLWGWQRQVCDVALELTEQGVWRWQRVAVIVPRQNGKTTLLSVLAALNLLAGRRMLYAAQSRDQAYQPFMDTAETIKQTWPTLVKSLVKANGRELVSTVNGGVFRLATPRARAIRGSVLDIVFLDEALLMDAEFVATLRPTQTTREMAQTWYVSSAGDENSEVLRKVVEQGRARGGPDDTCLFEWGAPDELIDSAPGDVETWRTCIPTLGESGGARVEAVASAAQDMTAVEFAREYLGRWSESTVDAPISVEQWQAARERGRGGGFDGRVVFAVDVSPDQRFGSICAGGWQEGGGGVVRVELVEHREGLSWLRGRLEELVGRHNPSAVVVDLKSPAAAAVDRMEGVPLEKVDWGVVTRASARFVSLLESGGLAAGDATPLDQAVRTAVRRTVGAGWAFKRSVSDVPISPLVAAAFAADRAARALDSPWIVWPEE